jgi:hypothetical protein
LVVMGMPGKIPGTRSDLVARVLGKLPKLSRLHPTVKPGAGSVSARKVLTTTRGAASKYIIPAFGIDHQSAWKILVAWPDGF